MQKNNPATAAEEGPHHINRRTVLAAGLALGLGACGSPPKPSEPPPPAPPPTPEGHVTVDLHSHAGRVILSRRSEPGQSRPFLPLAAPMAEGGVNVICLAIVADTPTTRVSADRKRIEPFRTPEPGELAAFGEAAFARAAELVKRENLHVVKSTADLRAAPQRGPSVIITSEGADFLDGRIERLEMAYRVHHLRQLQLTHYRVNELGDIQTEPPQHGGLTDFGAEVVRRCNALGIVVDIAHGTLDLVRRVASISTRPLVLSHTSYALRPGPRSRQISREHAVAVAATGGVIGVWPSAGVFTSIEAMAAGMKRLAGEIGVDHVGVGTDMLGFIEPPVLQTYTQWPRLAAALRANGFSDGDVTKMMGDNYLRVFTATLG